MTFKVKETDFEEGNKTQQWTQGKVDVGGYFTLMHHTGKLLTADTANGEGETLDGLVLKGIFDCERAEAVLVIAYIFCSCFAIMSVFSLLTNEFNFSDF